MLLRMLSCFALQGSGTNVTAYIPNTDAKTKAMYPFLFAPSMQGALEFTDAAIGKLFDAARATGTYDSTLFIITAKHGQSPINQAALVKVDPAKLNTVIEAHTKDYSVRLSW